MSAQHTPRPSWLDGGAEAVAMAAEDGLLPDAQHTPGPWDRGRADGCTQVYGADGRLVANVEPHAGNSRLIAAAPDLLATLHDVLSSEPGPDLNDRVRAAIAKATGGAS